MSFNDILSFILNFRVRTILILCHQNADPDAICSAFALSQLLQNIKSDLNVEIGLPEGMSRISKIISEYLSIEVTPHELEFDKKDIISIPENTQTNDKRNDEKTDFQMDEAILPKKEDEEE